MLMKKRKSREFMQIPFFSINQKEEMGTRVNVLMDMIGCEFI
jgi:hypothetical protein